MSKLKAAKPPIDDKRLAELLAKAMETNRPAPIPTEPSTPHILLLVLEEQRKTNQLLEKLIEIAV